MNNENETRNAFPVFDSKGECHSSGYGLTKHELGAFMIAQGLVTNPSDQLIIAQLAFELSAEILNQFKN